MTATETSTGAATEPAGLYGDVVGQPEAVGLLEASATRPAHAYLLVGPQGSGTRAAARAFTAHLLCEHGGCGHCRTCTLARAERHPSITWFERDGAFLTVEQAREMGRLSVTSPPEGRLRIIVGTDFHLAQPHTAAALLKAVEEPPPTCLFVLLADEVTPDLVTIASRCVRVPFGPVPMADIVGALAARGLDEDAAREVAVASRGDVELALLLADDHEFRARRSFWLSVPDRIDGTGAAVSVLATEIRDLLDGVADTLLAARHEQEASAVREQVEELGARKGLLKEVDDKHRRERRRVRTTELVTGLATIGDVYRRHLDGPDAAAAAGAIDAVSAVGDALERNPNETLLLWNLLLRLPVLG